MIYWLSFCDASKKNGDRFLGACHVEAFSFREAIAKAWELGINPGGEVLATPVPPDIWVAERWMNRLMSRKECEEYEADKTAYGYTS